MKTPDGSLGSRGGDSHGTRVGETWEQTYDLEFQRLDPIPEEVILKLAGRVYHEEEIRIPLNNKQAIVVPDGREIEIVDLVQKGRTGEVIISYFTDDKNPWPFEISGWRVSDDAGGLHSTDLPDIKSKVSMTVGKQAETDTDNTKKTYQLKLAWKLPIGRTAVALVNPGYWEYRDNLGTFTIKIPKDSYLGSDRKID